MKRLDGKVAVVTGAKQGIGAGISSVLAINGASVILTDVSEKVEDTAKYLSGKNLSVESRIMDVTNQEQIQDVIERICEDYGKIDVLVNNAGIYPRMNLVNMSEDFLYRVFDINVFGIFRCTKSVLPNMMKHKYGKIVNISSVTGHIVGAPSGGQTAYGASKAAIVGFTKALALEVAQYGINVNAILPGYILSPSAFKLRGSKRNDDVLSKMQEFGYKIPLGRQGTPQDVGNLVLFLASDESNYLTGSEIVIDGGNILQEEYKGPYKPK